MFRARIQIMWEEQLVHYLTCVIELWSFFILGSHLSDHLWSIFYLTHYFNISQILFFKPTNYIQSSSLTLGNWPHILGCIGRSTLPWAGWHSIQILEAYFTFQSSHIGLWSIDSRRWPWWLLFTYERLNTSWLYSSPVTACKVSVSDLKGTH